MHRHQIIVYALSLALSKTVTRLLSDTVDSFLSSSNDLKGTCNVPLSFNMSLNMFKAGDCQQKISTNIAVRI